MNGLSTPGAMFIADLLTKNETLTYLNVTFNRIYNEGAAHIAKGLRVNETLHHLIVSSFVLLLRHIRALSTFSVCL